MAKGSGGQHGQTGPTARQPTFRLIQILRALAALMVVTHHATIMLGQRNHLPVGTWVNGGTGVDLFFVISGFVMTISAAPLLPVKHAARTFLTRRLERVVPMYWLVTTVKVAVLLLVPALGINAMGGFGHVLKSYLFIPSFNPQQAIEPVVVVGWTLNYEMGFYALFALALALRMKPIWVVGGPIVALAAWRVLRGYTGPVALEFFESTLPLEFLFGVLLALGLTWVRRIPWPVGIGTALLGLALLLFWQQPDLSIWRGVLWGLPAMAVVAGTISLEQRWGTRSPRWLLELGDASYSIYLIHTFALPGVGLLLSRLHQSWASDVSYALTISVLLSTVAGELTYRLLERPMNAWFKGRRRTAIPAVA